MKKVVEQTKLLGNYFNNENRIKIVTNVGGFSMDKPLSETERLKGMKFLGRHWIVLLTQT